VLVAAVAGAAVALSSHNGSRASGGRTVAVNHAVTGTANSGGGNAGSPGTCNEGTSALPASAASPSNAASSAPAATGGNAGVPAAPSNLAAQAVDTTAVQLTWTNNDSNQSGVVISLDGQQSVDLQGTTVSSYTWTGLSPNTQYYFYVASKIYGTPGDPTGYGNTQSAWVGPAYASTVTTQPPTCPPG
jgi:Fibronectin type III domain